MRAELQQGQTAWLAMAEADTPQQPACPQCGQAAALFDDARCLLVCESCGCVLSSDELVPGAVVYQDGNATSRPVPEADQPAQGVSDATLVCCPGAGWQPGACTGVV